MSSRKNSLTRSTEDSTDDGEEKSHNSSVQGAQNFPLPIASNTTIHDLILPDLDLVNAVQILALYLLQLAYSKETNFSRILADWLGLRRNQANIFLAKWFHKQITAEVQRRPIQSVIENELSTSISLLQSQLICDYARNKQEFC